MIKTSFTVTIRDSLFITGVTSIVPNLNGFLFFTEDDENYQIESHELIDDGISCISFEYFDDEVIEDLKRFPRNTIHDHRAVEKSTTESASTMGKFYMNNSHLGGTARPRNRI